jgi:ribonuclease P protein subunit RPR2
MKVLRDKKRVRRIALERIDILMGLAERVYREDKDRSNRYSTLAKKIAMRHSIPLPRRWKRRVCKRCGAFLKPGDNAIIRIYKGGVSILCLECNNRVRVPFWKERKLLMRLKGK